MHNARFTPWGGLALMLGALVFLPVKLRHLVDPDDSLLGVFMIVGFLCWLIGLLALWVVYHAPAGRLGSAGLSINVVGMVLLAVGHLGGGLFAIDHWALWACLILGAFGLTIGALLFGCAALRAHVLPRWPAVPLATGSIGLAWLLLTNSETSRTAFMTLRTLFGLGWLVLGYLLWSERQHRSTHGTSTGAAGQAGLFQLERAPTTADEDARGAHEC